MILDGKTVSKKVLEGVKSKVEKMDKKPHLVVILVGKDPASQIYVRNKQKAALEVGIKSTLIEFDENIEENILLDKIQELKSLFDNFNN